MNAKALMVAAVAALLGASLVSCSGTPSTPADALKEYTQRLNDGDAKGALSLVYDLRGIAPEDVLIPQGTLIPEPLTAKVQTPKNDAEIFTGSFEIGDYSGVKVDFVRDESGWKVRYPEYVVQLFSGEEGVAQLDTEKNKPTASDDRERINSTWILQGEDKELTENYIVVFGEETLTFSEEVPANQFHSAGTTEYEYAVSAIGQDRKFEFLQSEVTSGLELDAAKYEKLKKLFLIEKRWDVTEWPDISECVVTPSRSEGEIARVECEGGSIDTSQIDCESWKVKPAVGCDAYREVSSVVRLSGIYTEEGDAVLW